MPIERKLAAIMFTDIAGYTESMSKSESKTLNLLEKKRSILNPLIKEYKGTFVKEIGDGTLSYFESAVNAATCAVKLQETTYDDKDMNIRVGIHIGDIVFKDGDVFGGGVNVASRLESIAPPGGVCVSKSVYDELSNQDDFDGIELGLQSLKGVGRLIEVFGLKGDKLNEPKPSEYQDNKVDKHTDDEVPSIAIIPFENKGADEDVFYAYGISADLISDVTSTGLIRVASKKQIEDAGALPQDDLAKKLDVRYFANGELWRMGDMFQLSIELYDTKNKKLVWSDRWQEKWDNLPTIKGSLSDGLLKALDIKSKLGKQVETINTEAYEYFLRAKYKWEKRQNIEDTEIIRGLLKKAIKFDDNLLSARGFLGWTYYESGEYHKAMEIYSENIKLAHKLKDKYGIGTTLHNIGVILLWKGDYNESLDCFNCALEIFEEMDSKFWIGLTFNALGNLYSVQYEQDNALNYYTRSHSIRKELGDKFGMGISLSNIGCIYEEDGDYDTALKYYMRSLKISEEIGNKSLLGGSLNNIGSIYNYKFDYNKAVIYLEKSIEIHRELGDSSATLLNATINLFFSYKNLGKEYDIEVIETLIKKSRDLDFLIRFGLNYPIYQLLEDTSYLETAYTQVQEKADNLEPDVAAKFLSYPIPKAIVEEWEKVK